MPFSLDKLFIEWRRIVPNGVPNPKNDYHLVLLKEICFAKGIDKDIIDSVILALEQEETFTAKKKDTGKVVAFKSKESRDDAIEGGDYEEVDKKDDEKKKEKPTTKLGGDELSTDTYAKSLTSDEDNDIDDSDTETQSQDYTKPPEKETTSQRDKRRSAHNKQTDNKIRILMNYLKNMILKLQQLNLLKNGEVI